MSRFRKITRTLVLSLALAVLPLSGCARTLSVPVTASLPDRELTDCHAIQLELRELEPRVRDPFEYNEGPLVVLAVIAALFAAGAGIGWTHAKTTDPFFPPDSSHGDQERRELEDDEQFYKGMTYASLAAFVAFLGLNSALTSASEHDQAKQAAMRKRLVDLRRMRLENDCVDYGAQ